MVFDEGRQGSRSPTTDRSRAWRLVPGLERAAERPLSAKNCLVDVKVKLSGSMDLLIPNEVVLD